MLYKDKSINLVYLREPRGHIPHPSTVHSVGQVSTATAPSFGRDPASWIPCAGARGQ